VGGYCQRAGRASGEMRRHAAMLALVGGAIIMSSCEYLHYIHALTRTVTGLAEPARLFFRLGVLLLVFVPFYLIAARTRLLDPIISLGRCSLFLYWIHLELVFGKPTWFLGRRLEIDAWSGFLLMTLVALWVVAWLRLLPWGSLLRRGEPRELAEPRPRALEARMSTASSGPQTAATVADDRG
jgi:hypothetical protein